MNQFFNDVFNYLRQHVASPLCLNCHSVFLKENLLCDYCYQKLIIPKCSLKKREIGFSQTHFYLIDWVPDESNLISNLVYRLKNKKSPLAWKFFAWAICQELFKHNINNNYDFVIPLPGSNARSIHSQLFALYIAEYLQVQYSDVLVKNVNHIQKLKTLKERIDQTEQYIGFKSNELFTKEPLDKAKILFVDDILTTGETYKQSCSVVGNQENTTVLTLFYRCKIH